MVRQRAWFAFESDFLRFIPRQQRFHAVGQMPELIDGKVRWRPTAKINEVRLAPAHKWLPRIDRQLAQYSLEITTNSCRILVRINFEITEVAALPAKGNMNVNAQWIARSRRPFNCLKYLVRKLRLPKRIRWII